MGIVSSANYGHTLGRAIAFGYVRDEGGVTAEYVKSGTFDIEVAKRRYPARASLAPLYDPKGLRLKA